MNENCDCIKEERQAGGLDTAGPISSYRMLPSSSLVSRCGEESNCGVFS